MVATFYRAKTPCIFSSPPTTKIDSTCNPWVFLTSFAVEEKTHEPNFNC